MKEIKNVVILGGGTAGWLAAYIMSDFFYSNKLNANVKVIESSKIPTIGVGEGTTSIFYEFLKKYNLDETDFLKETKATLKFGIVHKDWKELGYTYYGPIDDPQLIAPKGKPENFEYLKAYAVAAGRPVSEIHLHTLLMQNKKVPYVYKDNNLELISPFYYAYHFDNSLVASYLKKRSQNIEIIDDIYTSSKMNDDGTVKSLHFESGLELEVDLVVDCSGFRKLIIGDQYKTKWKSYQDNLPVNRAMPFFLDINDDNYINYTLAWAQKFGWMWQIPTQERIGAGYVYCDQFISPDQAQEEIEKVLGHKIEPRRDIKFNSGRLEKYWVKNCLAIGLSSGFLEPLEATSIHSTLVQLILFASEYLKKEMDFNDDTKISDFNNRIGRQFDDFKTFLNMHYVSKRRDSKFWEYVADECISDETKKLISLWQDELPSLDHFDDYLSGLPHVQSQLYYPVVDGLGLLNKESARDQMSKYDLRSTSRKFYNEFSEKFNEIIKNSLTHNQFIDLSVNS